jgi:hypothetical protein
MRWWQAGGRMKIYKIKGVNEITADNRKIQTLFFKEEISRLKAFKSVNIRFLEKSRFFQMRIPSGIRSIKYNFSIRINDILKTTIRPVVN